MIHCQLKYSFARIFYTFLYPAYRKCHGSGRYQSRSGFRGHGPGVSPCPTYTPNTASKIFENESSLGIVWIVSLPPIEDKLLGRTITSTAALPQSGGCLRRRFISSTWSHLWHKGQRPLSDKRSEVHAVEGVLGMTCKYCEDTSKSYRAGWIRVNLNTLTAQRVVSLWRYPIKMIRPTY